MQGIDLVYSRLKSGRDVWIGRLVEAHVTVADLDEVVSQLSLKIRRLSAWMYRSLSTHITHLGQEATK
jgi:hypothetical protein